MLHEVQSKWRVTGRTELHERESMQNRNVNPKEGGPTGPRGEGKMA